MTSDQRPARALAALRLAVIAGSVFCFASAAGAEGTDAAAPAAGEEAAAAVVASLDPAPLRGPIVEEPPVAIVARVDLSEQRMYVYVEEKLIHVWPVSTGRKGYGTPTGRWKPEWMVRKWNSRKYDWAPMPHSIFFYRGYAIHGTTSIKRLGRTASHGCVRLHPKNAKALFALVEEYGKARTLISVVR